MARPEKNRRINQPPLMKGFKPFGMPSCKMDCIRISFEEYESIRLVNYEMLPQEKAAEQMQVSRPTLTRIYNKALKNIAKAFAEGKAIEIEGGNYQFEQDWFRCKRCHKLFEGKDKHIKCKDCIYYNEEELLSLNQRS